MGYIAWCFRWKVEQYVIEIDKLNSIINSIEKEMVVRCRCNADNDKGDPRDLSV